MPTEICQPVFCQTVCCAFALFFIASFVNLSRKQNMCQPILFVQQNCFVNKTSCKMDLSA